MYHIPLSASAGEIWQYKTAASIGAQTLLIASHRRQLPNRLRKNFQRIAQPVAVSYVSFGSKADMAA
jgi:hypothetical protein